MKGTLKILGLLLISMLLFITCKKYDPKLEPLINGNRDVFDASKIVMSFKYMDFVDENEGYAFAQTKEQMPAFQHRPYTILKTTGDNQWEVLNDNFIDEKKVSMSNYFIVKGGKAYSTALGQNTYINATRIYAIDLQTGQTTNIEYDESLLEGTIQLPSIDSIFFLSPSTQNGNIIAGIANPKYDNNFNYYAYFIDITTNKIIKMIEIEVIDEYKNYNTQHHYIGYKLSPYRFDIHLFSDNSFIVGPIAHPQHPDNLDYIFMTYDEGIGWSDNALKISAHDGVDVIKYWMGDMGFGNHYGTGIFGDKQGDVLYYLEHNSHVNTSKAKNSIYKITERGHNITKLPLTEEQMNSRYIMMGDADKGCIVVNGLKNWGRLWLTENSGNSWTIYDGLIEDFIRIDGAVATSNYYYFASDMAVKIPEGRAAAGIIRMEK